MLRLIVSFTILMALLSLMAFAGPAPAIRRAVPSKIYTGTYIPIVGVEPPSGYNYYFALQPMGFTRSKDWVTLTVYLPQPLPEDEPTHVGRTFKSDHVRAYIVWSTEETLGNALYEDTGDVENAILARKTHKGQHQFHREKPELRALGAVQYAGKTAYGYVMKIKVNDVGPDSYVITVAVSGELEYTYTGTFGSLTYRLPKTHFWGVDFVQPQ